MGKAPEVSVVMAVHNGGQRLAYTLESVLAQEGVGFEIIVVDDGSSDQSAEVLADYAQRDSRIRVVHQDHTGLTGALIRGCSIARGQYIARQDSGDLSCAGRLRVQWEILNRDSKAVMVSCGTRFVGPNREVLYESLQNDADLTVGLRASRVEEVRGPSHHGSTCFRRQAYEMVGGYRREFPVAQDLDLWLRLSEVGRCRAVPAVYYEAEVSLGSISTLRRAEQVQAARHALKCAQRRRAGQADRESLASLRIRPGRARPEGRWSRAAYYYYVASLLREHDVAAAKGYYRRAIEEHPLHLRALVGYLVT